MYAWIHRATWWLCWVLSDDGRVAGVAFSAWYERPPGKDEEDEEDEEDLDPPYAFERSFEAQAEVRNSGLAKKVHEVSR